MTWEQSNNVSFSALHLTSYMKPILGQCSHFWILSLWSLSAIHPSGPSLASQFTPVGDSIGDSIGDRQFRDNCQTSSPHAASRVSCKPSLLKHHKNDKRRPFLSFCLPHSIAIQSSRHLHFASSSSSSLILMSYWESVIPLVLYSFSSNPSTSNH